MRFNAVIAASELFRAGRTDVGHKVNYGGKGADYRASVERKDGPGKETRLKAGVCIGVDADGKPVYADVHIENLLTPQTRLTATALVASANRDIDAATALHNGIDEAAARLGVTGVELTTTGDDAIQ